MLNVFKQTYYPIKYLSNWPKNVKTFFRAFKYAYQRATQGYCDEDIWDLDYFYSELFYATLKELAKTSHSYPGRKPYDTFEKWTEALNKTADEFKNSQTFNDDYFKNQYADAFDKLPFDPSTRTPGEKEIAKKFCDEEMRICLEKEKMHKEAFEWLKNNFNDLWD